MVLHESREPPEVDPVTAERNQDDLDAVSSSSWEPQVDEKKRDASMETDSLTFEGSSSEDSLDASILDDRDDCVSAEFLRRRHLRHEEATLEGNSPLRRWSPLPLERFDSGGSFKIHSPSKEKVQADWRRRALAAVLLLAAGLFRLRFIVGHHLVQPGTPRVTPSPRFLRRVPRLLSRKDARRIHRAVRRSHPDESFTIKISGSRLDLIQKSIDAHAGCPSVAQVVIDWKSELQPPNKIYRHVSRKVTPLSDGFSSNALFVLAEDVSFTCDELERAFHLWRKNYDRMVGFFAFQHEDLAPEEFQQKQPPEYSLHSVRRGSGPYSLVSSRAAFLHKDYLESFRQGEMDPCQEVALSIHCTAISSKAPLVVAAQPQELRTLKIDSSMIKIDDTSMEHDSSSTCLQEWIRGNGMKTLPWEKATYVGR